MPHYCPNTDDFDVIVVGAGPAGCATAITARRSGLRVLLLEAARRSLPAPGETLHPGIEPILAKLDLFEQVLQVTHRRHPGIWIASNGRRVFQPYGTGTDGGWRDLQVDRSKFHEILRRAACVAGATYWPGNSPDRLLLGDEGVTGVMVKGRPLRAAVTVDATGRRAWLARALKLEASLRSPPLGVQFGWYRRDAREPIEHPTFEMHAKGWNWRSPLGRDRFAWVSLAIAEAAHCRPCGTDMTWRLHRSCAGPGYFLTGDAAALFDPSLSHGVLRALMSGILVGHLAKTSICSPARHAVVEAYKDFVCDQFESDEMALRARYAAFRTLNANSISS